VAPAVREHDAHQAGIVPIPVVLVAGVCVIKAGAAALGLPIGSIGSPVRAALFCALVLGFTSSGLLLLVRGRTDNRAVSLGAFFLLIGSAFSDVLLINSASAPSRWQPTLAFLAYLQVAAFQPFFFWRFVSEFPRRPGPYARNRLARAGASAAWGIGIILLTANLVLAFAPPHSAAAGHLAWMNRHDTRSLYWPILFAVVFPVLPYIAWKARRATSDERRRAALLLTGIVVGVAPIMLLTIAETLSPRLLQANVTPVGRLVVGIIVYPPLLSIPVITAYAIIVHRALDVRLIIRKAIRYALARSTLVFATAVPFVLLIGLVYSHRHESMASVTAGREGALLLMLTVTGGAVIVFRPRLFNGLDRRFFREQYDARSTLASLVDRARMVRDPFELTTIVPAEIDRALHLESASLLLLDAAGGVLATPTGAMRPLAVGSSLAQRLSRRDDDMVDIDWSRPETWMDAAPDHEKEWLLESNARLLLLLRGRAGTLLGVLALGEKRSGLPFSGEDLLLLRAVVQAAALAVENAALQASAATGNGAEAQTAAMECGHCGRVATPDRTRCVRCGAELEPSVVPPLVAGKFEPIERIGRGGMGVVYRALDVALTREVALKTLPKAAPAGAARMRREARAMAAVSHPNLEVIYAVESWRGIPMLIVELLRGGTLADRLRDGPVDIDVALDVGVAIAEALGCLHRSGILHRDIKPSNIGFSEDGIPKLLDFGLAWMLEVAHVEPRAGTLRASAPIRGDRLTLSATGAGGIVGTLAYLSPETVRGAPLTPAVDLWALSVVLYEAVAGRNPFLDGSPDGIMRRIAEQAPDVREYRADVPDDLADFLRESLSLDLSRRPGSARGWSKRASGIRRSLMAESRT
jgi:hypothetical protein